MYAIPEFDDPVVFRDRIIGRCFSAQRLSSDFAGSLSFKAVLRVFVDVVIKSSVYGFLHLFIRTYIRIEHIDQIFQYPLKTFHRSVVDTSGYPGHGLCHPQTFQCCPEYFSCVLKSSVGVEERGGRGIVSDRVLQCLIDQCYIIVPAEGDPYRITVIEIDDR